MVFTFELRKNLPFVVYMTFMWVYIIFPLAVRDGKKVGPFKSEGCSEALRGACSYCEPPAYAQKGALDAHAHVDGVQF